jgi:hypothetical protein
LDRLPALVTLRRFFNRPAIGAGLFKPVHHLFHADLLRIKIDPVDFARPAPTLGYRYDSRPPCQGGCADIVSADLKSRLCRLSHGGSRGISGQEQTNEKQATNPSVDFHTHPPFFDYPGLSRPLLPRFRSAHLQRFFMPRRPADCASYKNYKQRL